MEEDGVFFDDTPLALVGFYLREKKVGGKDATESQLHSLEVPDGC